MEASRRIADRFISENSDALKNGITKAEFKNVYNAIAKAEGGATVSSQIDAKNAISKFYKVKVGFITVDDKTVQVWKVNDAESSKSDSISETATDEDILVETYNYDINMKDINSMYIGLCLFITNQSNWQKYMLGLDPEKYAQVTRKWLVKQSMFVYKLENDMDLNIKVIPRDDLIKKFYCDHRRLRDFCVNDLDLDEFVAWFAKVVKAITVNHPEWNESYLKRMEKKRKEIEEDLERQRREAPLIAARKAKEEADRIEKAAKAKAEMEERERKLKDTIESLRIQLLPYGYVSKDETDIVKMRNMIAMYSDEIKYIDSIKDKPFEKLTLQDLNTMHELGVRVYNVEVKKYKDSDSFYSFSHKDVETQYLINRIVYTNLKAANSKFVFEDEEMNILPEYEKYMSVKPENFCDELETYDDFAIYKLLADKMIELWNKLYEIDPTDYDLKQVKEYAQRNVSSMELYGLLMCEGGDCRWLESFYIRRSEMLTVMKTAIKMHEYRKYTLQLVKKLEAINKKTTQNSLQKQHADREDRLEKIKKENRRKAAELKWAMSKDNYLCLFKESGNDVWRNMHFNENRKCFFYYPDEFNTSITKEVAIEDVKDETRWRKPEIEKDTEAKAKEMEENATMKMFKSFMAFGNFVNSMASRGVSQTEAFKMLAEKAIPTVDEPETSYDDYSDDREAPPSGDDSAIDDEVEQKDEEINEMRDELKETKQLMKQMMLQLQELQRENKKLRRKAGK